MEEKKLPKGIRKKGNGYEARAMINGSKITVRGMDLDQVMADFIEAKERALGGDIRSNLTLDEWFEEWFDTVQAKKVKDTSIRPMKNSYKRNFGFYVGKMKLKDIKPMDLQGAINALQKKGKINTNTRDALGRLSKCLAYAVANGLIDRNPCLLVEVPWENKASKEEIALTKEEQNRFLQAAEDSWYIVLIVLSFMDINYSPVSPIHPENMSFIQAAGQGLLIGIWFNTGYETIATMAGEIEDGSRLVPKAIVIAVPIVSIMYILFVMPALASVGNWEQWSSEGPLSFVTIGSILGGPALQWAFVASGSLSSILILSEYIAANSRVMSSMARRGEFFRFMGIEHKKYKTPYVALIIIAAVNIIICSSSNFVQLVGLSAILYAVPIILMFVGAIYKRVTEPEARLDYKVPVGNKLFIGYSILPIILYIYSIFMDEWQVGIGLILTAVPAYLFFKYVYHKGRIWQQTH